MAQPEVLAGNANCKRNSWYRKHVSQRDLRFSIRKQKKEFQRKVRNGKLSKVELPIRGNSYRKLLGKSAKWDLY